MLMLCNCSRFRFRFRFSFRFRFRYRFLAIMHVFCNLRGRPSDYGVFCAQTNMRKDRAPSLLRLRRPRLYTAITQRAPKNPYDILLTTSSSGKSCSRSHAHNKNSSLVSVRISDNGFAQHFRKTRRLIV